MQQYFTEQGEDYAEALGKVREKYGDRVTILMRKTVRMRGGFLGLFSREGVEVTGIVPNLPLKGQNLYAGGPGMAGDSAPLREPPPRESGSREPGSLRELGSLREPLDFEEEKKKILAVARGGDSTIQLVLSEVRNIKEKIEQQSVPAPREEHPAFSRIEEILVLNDFSSSYRENIRSRIKKEFSLEALDDYDAVQDKVLEWIGESISVFREKKFYKRPKIMILVGPTGVGKTTTIAKLAAGMGIDSSGQHIRQIVLITIDAFRLGAKEQMESYGEILCFPCYAVEDYMELKKTIDLNLEADLILVDTIGKSPRDMVKLGEMKQLLDACGSFAEVHLALSAATKTSDIKEILRQFEPFNYRAVIVTKLDETIRTGNVISALADAGKSISYITNGQKVPADIRKASVVQFLTNLEGFKVNRIKIEGQFPEDESGQIRQWG
jgi:flagellar biosynthesis protein FlhF